MTYTEGTRNMRVTPISGVLVKYTQDALAELLAKHAAALENARASASVVMADDFKVETTDDERAVADHLAQIAEGLGAAAAIKSEAGAEAKRAAEIVRDGCAFVEHPLKAADAKLRQLTEAFRKRDRERIRREQEQQRIAAEQAAHEAAEAARATNVPPPPPPDIPQVVRPNATAGGVGAIHGVARLHARLVNVHECDPTWLSLVESQAIAWANDMIRRGEMDNPKLDDAPVRIMGCEFYREETLSRSPGVRR